MSDVAEPSSSTAETETGVDVAVEAAKLLGQGRRHLLVGDAPTAVQVLQEACGLLASKYGETADELGETYYHYGVALLELGRMENGVLGNALDGVPDAATDDSDEDEGDEKVESAAKLQEKEKNEIIEEVGKALESTCDTEKKGTDQAMDKNGEKNDQGIKDELEEKMDTGNEKEDGEKAVSGNEEQSEEKMDTGKDEKKDETVVNGDQAKDDPKSNEDKSADQANEEKNDSKAEDMGKTAEDASKAKKEEDGEAKKEDGEAKKEDGDALTEGEKKDEGAGSSKADDDKDGEKEGDEAAEAKTDEDSAEDTAGEDGEKGEGEDADDVPNFQLCWEILELARVIFGRKDDKDFKLKVSQVHLKLGELGLETEQYSQSIDDFTHCLNIQKEHLEPESRLLAETHYNLGLAYGFDKRFSEAIESFEGAKKVIESRIAKLEKSIKENEGEGKGKEKADAEDPVVKDQKEIAELQDLLPEITAKLEDAKDMKKSSEDAASKAIAAAAAEFGLGAGSSSSALGEGSSSSAFGASSSSEPAKPIQVRKAGDAAPSDISHLVRRKRKPDEEGNDSKEEAEGAAMDAKRSKPDEAGDAPETTANGHTTTVNGHASLNGNIAPEKQEVKDKTEEKKVNGDAAPAAAMETA